MDYNIWRIGDIDNGCDGKDVYLLVTAKEDDIDIDASAKWLERHCLPENHGYFLSSIVMVPKPDNYKSAIAIIKYRCNN